MVRTLHSCIWLPTVIWIASGCDIQLGTELLGRDGSPPPPQ